MDRAPWIAGGLMRILVTGTAGFIGFHLTRRLLHEGHEVVGIDGMTPYYDVALKQARHAQLRGRHRCLLHEVMLEDVAALGRIFAAGRFDAVIHLAAQAGVRYSLENPRAYVGANLVGTCNLLELCREHRPNHLLLASTSSVYGANRKTPFAETDPTDHPLSLYAATKKSCEVMAHAYAHLWSIPTTAFRFFTVYGPWGRPDMALFRFTAAIIAGKPIDVYNRGDMARDFTYVDDLVESVVRLLPLIPRTPLAQSDTDDLSLSPAAPYRVINIGAGRPVNLLAFIQEIERAVGKSAIRNFMDIQPGDVPSTFADASLLQRLTNYKPATPISVGVPAFVAWYREYYGLRD
jgi:UDP-glucuronate 4-epimerase